MAGMYSNRDVIAQVNLDALRHNVNVLRQQCRPRVRLCAALKANAYGHSVGIVAPLLAQTAVSMAAVATIGEAIELRQLGWAKPILLFGPIFADGIPSGRKERLRSVLEYDLTATVVDFYGARDLVHEAEQRGKIVRCHIKIDSGMGRMGISPAGAVQLAQRLQELPSVAIEGVYTHFATADEADKSYCQEQLRVFREAIVALQTAGLRPWLVHTAGTGAMLDMAESHFDMVRPGIGLYGLFPGDQVQNRPDLRPVLKVTSRLVLVKKILSGQSVGYGRTWTAQRDSITGIVPIGYHDGYLRSLSNRAAMTVRGQLAPVIGRVSMDQTLLDLTDVPGALVGDEVVVIDDNPLAPNSVVNLARIMQTIPYEVVALLGSRVARVACTDDGAASREAVAAAAEQTADAFHDSSLAGMASASALEDSSLMGEPVAGNGRRRAEKVPSVAKRLGSPGLKPLSGGALKSEGAVAGARKAPTGPTTA
jgi:alanine racemase